MTRRLAAVAVVTTACAPGLPPPSHYAAMGPAPTYDRQMGEIVATPLSLPPFTLAGSYTVPAGPPWLLLEGQGQVGYTHASASPAVWFVPGRDEPADGLPRAERSYFGIRLGGAIGSGDVLGMYDRNMPHAGPTLHLQYARIGAERSTFAFTFGAELLLPFFPDQQVLTYTDDNGVTVTAFPFPALWPGVDFRGDIPVGERVWIVVGAGLDVSLPFPLPSPNLTLGLRF